MPLPYCKQTVGGEELHFTLDDLRHVIGEIAPRNEVTAIRSYDEGREGVVLDIYTDVGIHILVTSADGDSLAVGERLSYVILRTDDDRETLMGLSHRFDACRDSFMKFSYALQTRLNALVRRPMPA